MTINDIITKLREGKLDSPNVLADYLVKLSASLYDTGMREAEAEILYLKRWAELKLDDNTDKMTDALSKQSDEYIKYRQLQIITKTTIQCIQSLKKKLLNLEDEWKSGQNYH